MESTQEWFLPREYQRPFMELTRSKKIREATMWGIPIDAADTIAISASIFAIDDV